MNSRNNLRIVAVVSLTCIQALVGCYQPGNGLSGDRSLPDTSQSNPNNPVLNLPGNIPSALPGEPGAKIPSPTVKKAVLLFNGVGVSTSDWENTEAILDSLGLSYRLVNSDQMNVLTLNDLIQFGLIIIPGGNGQ